MPARLLPTSFICSMQCYSGDVMCLPEAIVPFRTESLTNPWASVMVTYVKYWNMLKLHPQNVP